MQMEIGVYRIESAILTAIERFQGDGWSRASRWKRWQKYSPYWRLPICPRHGESILPRRNGNGTKFLKPIVAKLLASVYASAFKLENFSNVLARVWRPREIDYVLHFHAESNETIN